MENQNFTKKQWIIIIAILFCLSVFIGWRLYKYTHSVPNPAITNTKSAKAKTEAQIEGKDAERVEITTEQVAKNDKHVLDTKKDMKAVDRIVHRQPIKDAEYDSMYNVVKNARP
jgi:hypothetical protein